MTTRFPSFLIEAEETLNKMGIVTQEKKTAAIARLCDVAKKTPRWVALIKKGKFYPSQAIKAATYSRPENIKKIEVREFEDLKTTVAPTLAVLKKYFGEALARAVIVELLNDVRQFFNVKQGLNDGAVSLLAEFIQTDYYFLTVADLKLCFRRAMLGEHGETYNRVDAATIILWLKAYDMEKQNHIDKKHEDRKASPLLQLTSAPPYILDALNDLNEMFLRKKAAEALKGVEYQFNEDEKLSDEVKEILKKEMAKRAAKTPDARPDIEYIKTL